MKLVVGLGNPGRQYEQTRHNVGFAVLDALAKRLGIEHTRQRFEGLTAEARVGGDTVLLLWPQTYMNLSGRSVVAARDFYQLPNRDVLIVCDDFSLPLGRLRFRKQGSSGGQKGLDNILLHCGIDVPRLRIGIGPVPEGWDPAKFVLSRFPAHDQQLVERVVTRAVEATLDWIEHGIDYCMNQYNAAVELAEGPPTTHPTQPPSEKNRRSTC